RLVSQRLGKLEVVAQPSHPHDGRSKPGGQRPACDLPPAQRHFSLPPDDLVLRMTVQNVCGAPERPQLVISVAVALGSAQPLGESLAFGLRTLSLLLEEAPVHRLVHDRIRQRYIATPLHGRRPIRSWICLEARLTRARTARS